MVANVTVPSMTNLAESGKTFSLAHFLGTASGQFLRPTDSGSW